VHTHMHRLYRGRAQLTLNAVLRCLNDVNAGVTWKDALTQHINARWVAYCVHNRAVGRIGRARVGSAEPARAQILKVSSTFSLAKSAKIN
jgi:hypothetical protein